MEAIQKTDINKFVEAVCAIDPKPFRQKQLVEWLYCKGASSFDEMSNVPKSLKDGLKGEFSCVPSKIVSSKGSADGSCKHLIELCDGQTIECVAILAKGHKDKLTACVSSQVGCTMGCCFCATGKLGFVRNLGFGEIVEQVMLIEREHDKKVSNIVVMGQGEPFLNYDNVIIALDILNTFKPYEIGARKISISSCGIISGIERFSTLNKQYRLAISLHSADQDTRNVLMPGLRKQNLKSLRKALLKYQEATGRRISIEYIMIKDINDTEKQLDALYEFLMGIKAHINLIPYNKVKGVDFKPSTRETLSNWENFFKSAGIGINIRESKGAEVFGACGQLANKA